MLKQKNRIFSTLFTAFLLFSILIIPTNTKACEDEPQSFLSLYTYSDLIILADFDDERTIKKEEADEYGYWSDVERDLTIVQVLKGQNDLQKISFTNSEYRANSNTPVEEYEEYESKVDYGYGNYFDISQIKTGGRYLFFLTKDKETGTYSISDYRSGVKDVAGKFDIYEKNINELNAISKTKENQLAKLTEWLIKSIEEPELRDDGISDLSANFYMLEYEQEYPEENTEETPVENETFPLYTAAIAKNLTDSQKQRIYTTLEPLMQEYWFAQKPKYVSYETGKILGSINKTQTAVTAYNLLQAVDRKDSVRKQLIMEFIVNVIGDSNLSDVYYKITNADYEIEELGKNPTAETKKKLKEMKKTRTEKLKEFDTRFKFMFARNFEPVPDDKVTADADMDKMQ